MILVQSSGRGGPPSWSIIGGMSAAADDLRETFVSHLTDLMAKHGITNGEHLARAFAIDEHQRPRRVELHDRAEPLEARPPGRMLARGPRTLDRRREAVDASQRVSPERAQHLVLLPRPRRSRYCVRTPTAQSFR